MEEQKNTTITDIINELKRLQVETGQNLEVCITSNKFKFLPGRDTANAWPTYNQEKNRIEF